MINNIHSKLMNSVQTMLVDTFINLPYYGEFNLHVNFKEQKTIGTCAVNVTSKGMNFLYCSEFLNNLSQKEVNFVMLHEDFHLLFNHPQRTIVGNYDLKISNIVQDMIINHIIWSDISHTFIDIPKDKDGKNMALFVPVEYTGKLIFEELYTWFKEEKDKWEKNGKKKPSVEYGEYGKDPKSDNGKLETWSKEKIFNDLENNSDFNGEYMDKHINNDVSDDVKNSIIKDVMNKLEARGLSSHGIEKTLGRLRKERKDYLSYIKKCISNTIMGTIKEKTIYKPSRRGGIKGNRKLKSKINCVWDTSGSMNGAFERVLSFIYRNDIEVNLIEVDTEVNRVTNIKSKRKLNMINVKGFGGTILQPAIDLISDKYNKYNTVILTDGYCDRLDLSKIKGRILIISIGVEVPISSSNGKIKQILVEITK